MNLKIDNLVGGYGKNEVLHGISFSLNKGEVLCVLGPNGCGKSTLLKILLRFAPKMKGKVYLDDQNIDKFDRQTFANLFSYIPQSDNMMFPYTILEMVSMGRSCHIGKWSTPSKKDIEIAYQSLEKLHISHMADKLYTSISGGERQLVLIARALCQESEILVMDEPTSSLDFSNQQLIMNAISSTANDGKSVILTTHSPSLPFLIASKVLLLSEGNTVGFGKPLDVLTNESLEAVYGIPMDILTVVDRNLNKRNICLPAY